MTVQMNCHNKWLTAFRCCSIETGKAKAKNHDCRAAKPANGYPVKRCTIQYKQEAMVYRGQESPLWDTLLHPGTNYARHG